MFLPELDEKKTRENAKRKLREWRRLKYIAGETTQKVTQVYTFDPRPNTGQVSKPVERLAINKIDAEADIERIEWAVSNLWDPMHRRILIDLYLRPHPFRGWQVQEMIGYEKSQFNTEKNNALMAFAELYRNGVLLSEK